jgi:hypothetical protein
MRLPVAHRAAGNMVLSRPVAQEIALAGNSGGDKENASSGKAQRAEDGRRAMRDYESAADALRAKTARLRELRLARDAATVPAPSAQPRKRPAQRAKAKSESLAAWLKDRDDSGHSR